MAKLLAAAQANPLLAVMIMAVALTCIALLTLGVLTERDSRLHARRLNRVQNAGTRIREAVPGLSVRRSTKHSSIDFVDTLIKTAMPNPDKLRDRLMRTGRNISLGEYLMSCILVALVVMVALKIFVPFIPLLADVLFGIFGGLALPHVTVGIMAKRRINKFIAGFPDAIDLLARGLKSGLPVTESIRAVVTENDGPIGAEFRRITDEIKLGSTMPEALGNAAARLNLAEFHFFTIALAIQQETGGNLAETLGNLSDILRRRKAMKLKIKALSSEAKASAYIIGSLPFLMFAVIMTINPEYESQLLTDKRGIIMIIGALISITMGAGVMAKMCRFEI